MKGSRKDMESTASCKSSFVAEVKSLSAKHDYTGACAVATEHKLHAHFALNEFVLPLMLNDDPNSPAEAYMREADSDQKLALIKWLDDLTENTSVKMNEMVEKYSLKSSREFGGQSLQKLIVRLLTIFKLKADCAPKFDAARKKQFLAFLINEGNSEKMQIANWRDVIALTVVDNEALQRELISLLTTTPRGSASDLRDAAYWAKRLNMPSELLPIEVREKVGVGNEENIEIEDSSGPEDNEAAEKNFLKLPDTCESFIIPVKTKMGLIQMMAQLRRVDVAGFACEHRPAMYGSSLESASLLQIATRREIFVVDMLVLGRELGAKDWKMLVDGFFASGDILKLCYDLNQDVGLVERAIPDCFNLSEKCQRMLPLDSLWQKCISEGIVKVKQVTSKKGRSGLVEAALGKTLDEQDLISDWNKRPLSRSQLSFAALDAHVLVRIYDGLIGMAMSKGTMPALGNAVNSLSRKEGEEDDGKEALKSSSFASRMSNVDALNATHHALKEMTITEAFKVNLENLKESKGRGLPMPDCWKAMPRKPSQTGVICDNMLQKLCRKLRFLGVDALCLEPGEDLSKCAAISKEQRRFVITQGQDRYLALLPQLDLPWVCYPVTQEKVEDQVAEVLRFFNVTERDSGMRMRCLDCNHRVFFLIPGSAIVAMKEKKAAPKKRQSATATSSSSSWLDCGGAKLNLDTFRMKSGMEPKIDGVPMAVAKDQESFYTCCACGQMYWMTWMWDAAAKKNVNVVQTGISPA